MLSATFVVGGPEPLENVRGRGRLRAAPLHERSVVAPVGEVVRRPERLPELLDQPSSPLRRWSFVSLRRSATSSL